MKKRKKFWMLYAEGSGSPTTKHDNYLTALTEAKRLMDSKQSIARIYILEAVGVVEAEVIRNLYHEGIEYDETRNIGFRDLLRPEDFQPVKDDNGELHSGPTV